jgi:carbonic anhydrase
MLRISDEEFHQLLEEHTGERPKWHPMTFTDIAESVRGSIARIKDSPFIPRTDAVRGFVYDVETGRLGEVR